MSVVSPPPCMCGGTGLPDRTFSAARAFPRPGREEPDGDHEFERVNSGSFSFS